MPSGVTIIHLDHEHLLAVHADLRAGRKSDARVRLRSWTAAMRPAGLDPSDPAKVGLWVKEELRRAKMPAKAAVLALPRSEAILKHVPLSGERPDEGELAEMVRLQMVRQLTVSTEGSAIDYVPLEAGESDGAEEPDRGRGGVLVGAVPGDRMRWHEKFAASAGVKLRGLELRATGTAALLSEASSRTSGPLLGVDLGAASVEFVLVEGGELVFARSVYLPRPMMVGGRVQGGVQPEPAAGSAEGDGAGAVEKEGPTLAEDRAAAGEDANAAYARRVALEAKRTWMSFRVSRRGPEVDRVAVVGEDDLALRVRDACAAALELPAEAVALPAAVEASAAGDSGADDVGLVAPLLGVALRRAGGMPGLDFANPRKPPDKNAKYRQLALAAVVPLLGFGGFMFLQARDDLGRLEERKALADQRVQELSARYGAHIKAEARLAHLEHWLGASVDWLAHARAISDGLPEPGPVLLDELTGTTSIASGRQVIFEPKNGGYPGAWKSVVGATFGLAGSVRDQQVTWAFRDAFIGSEAYRVSIQGPDVERRFDLRLITQVRAPEPPAGEAVADDEPGPGDGQRRGGVAAGATTGGSAIDGELAGGER